MVLWWSMMVKKLIYLLDMVLFHNLLYVHQRVYPNQIPLKPTWWLTPQIVSGWNNPGDFNGIFVGASRPRK